jgi:general secretion pathway protein E
MGIEPFLLASSLIGVLAQRLVRVLDPACRESYQISQEELDRLGLGKHSPTTLYRPRQDLAEGDAPYRGRTGIYELVTLNEALRQGIHDGASERALSELARQVAPPMLEDGWNKARAGVTSLEEVLRVTQAG